MNHSNSAFGSDPCKSLAWILIPLIVFAGHPGSPAAESPTTPGNPRVFNVRAYGASGDGQTLETKAINRAVADCGAAGGGQVVFPPGTYLSGTVVLTNGVTLLFEAGSKLVGSTNLADYRSFDAPDRNGVPRYSAWHRALILGVGVHDVAVMGKGVIDGHKVFDPRGEERMRGPHTILLGNSRGALIRDITIVDSANYAMLFRWSDQIEVRDVKATGGWDGVHFRNNRNVTITGCQFYTGDDSIAGSYWDNVLVSDCIINSSCNGVRLIGPATNLVIHNCLFFGPGREPHRSSNRSNMLAGINLQPGAWESTRGALDRVLISEITMRDVAAPFHVVLKPGNSGGTLQIQKVHASGVYRSASSVENWSDAAFKEVIFRDVVFDYTGGITRPELRLDNIKPPGVDPRGLPVWGFYARGIERLILDHVRLNCGVADSRPAVFADGVENLHLDRLSFSRFPNVPRSIVLTNVGHVEFEKPWANQSDLLAP